MTIEDPMAPITRLPNLAFTKDSTNDYGVLYTPIRRQKDIINIPVTTNLTGAIVFNKDTEELETYTAAGFWLPILTAESNINVEEITATTITTDTLHTTLIYSTALLSTSINNSGTITTSSLNVNNSLSAGGITVGNLDVSSDFSVGGALAGSTTSSDVSPLTVSLNTGSGTGATSTIKGSLTSGVFTLNTGTSPATGGVIGTFTIPALAVDHFTGSYGVMFSAVNSVTLPFPVYVTTGVSSSTFTIGLGASTTLSASTQYKWNYHVMGSIKQ
jgi:hypothetical protein